MILNKKKAIFFDMDGTLVDSSKDLASAVNFMLKSIGRKEFEEKKIQEWVGNGALILTKRALSGSVEIDKDLDEELVEKSLQLLLDYYSKHLCIKTKDYPNVKETLKELRNIGYKMAVITNKPYEFVPTILEKLGLMKYFDLILGADSLPKKKPDPMPLLYACKNFDIKPYEALMVGDSKSDILAAKSADIDVVAVNYGYNHGESLQKYEPNIIIEDFKELLEILKGDKL